MKRFTIAVLIFAGALASHGQPPKPAPAKADTPPVVSDAIKLRFFKAEFEFTQASDQATAASNAARDKQTALQSVVKELETACGDKFQPQMSNTHDPECVPKPPALPTPPKPPVAPAK